MKGQESKTRVVIGMDPHKRSVTIEVMDGDEHILGGGRYATDAAGYRSMLDHVRAWPNRVWAIEGCNGIGRHIAHRLIADGEQVVDVPPKLSARARVFATGQGRKTDVVCPAFFGQRIVCCVMPRTCHSGIRCGLRGVSGSRVLNGFCGDCRRPRCSWQYPRLLSFGWDRSHGELARS